ncbi:hypothetical protein LEL_04571 [Akanthomyces lecanii RCEF 1005]|uniref:Uncharacterized protein n=1 Tax=Akanthomyces lecanii RCEF 1005 TaxID=1081108 RepID=A0A162KNW7_CORDF|nr:hypothetical protein LEL_04571 [Akanthomyces lecanii RCEF 1005]
MADDASPSTAARPSLRHAKSGGGNKADGSNPATTTTATATSTGIGAPPGHALRRAKTAAETSTRRLSSDSSAFESPHPPPRRSSNFSDYGVNEARSILNPHGKAAQGSSRSAGEQGPELSSLAGLSLAFALLPAIAGALFKNGSAVTTDIMLLGLAGVFLHWSVTQPWLWYHSAQQVRIEHEENAADEVFDEEEDSDDDDNEEYADGASHLDDVPEEATAPREEAATDKKTTATASAKQQSALSELYLHEVMALVSCFSLPLISAFILHMIRSQLSRPSEGLVSNYNLTIFILVSEVRVLSHMIKLVQARTLHLQRVVHSSSNPFGTLPTTNSLRINAMLERLDALESDPAPPPRSGSNNNNSNVLPEEDEETAKAAQEAVLTKDVRNAIQPELDALNRAVRRYEKKSTLLQSHVDAHFAAMDARVEDAIALAAVAAKNSNRSSILVRAFDSVVALALFPFNAVLQLLLMPVKWLLSRSNNNNDRGGSSRKRNTAAASSSNGGARAGGGGGKASARGSRGSKTTAQPRYSGDKMPSRLARK